MDLMVYSDCCDGNVQEDTTPKPKGVYYYKCLVCGRGCSVTKKMPKKGKSNEKAINKNG